MREPDVAIEITYSSRKEIVSQRFDHLSIKNLRKLISMTFGVPEISPFRFKYKG